MVDQETLLLAALASGLHQCKAVFVEDGGLLLGLLMTGLVGGVTHCTGMCGPFVLSQVTARLEAQPASRMREWHRLAGAALLPYHLGRATTYAALGAAAAGLAGGLMAGGGLRWLSAALLAAAALFMLGMAVPRLRMAASGGGAWWSQGIGRLARPLFAAPTGWRGWLLGVALGFIPCGLVYGALAAAAAPGDPLTGAIAMLAFTLGTVPSLLGVGLLGHLAGHRWRGTLLRYAPLMLVLNAGVLTYLAWRTVA